MPRALLILTGVALLFVVIYGFPVVSQMYQNAGLTSEAPLQHVYWSIKKIHEEEWRPVAKFRYEVDGHLFEHEEVFQGKSYKNPYSAESALNELQDEFITVHYAPRNPKNASLELYFPKKRAIYSLVLFALLFYFVGGVRWYANRHLKEP